MKHCIIFIFGTKNLNQNTFIILVNLKILKNGMMLEKVFKVLFIEVLRKNLHLQNVLLKSLITMMFQFGNMKVVSKLLISKFWKQKERKMVLMLVLKNYVKSLRVFRKTEKRRSCVTGLTL